MAALSATLVGAQGQAPPATQAPTFRSGVELVVIDAQVVARDGVPLEALKAGDFEVFIDGRRRPVVSAEFVRVSTAPVPPAKRGGPSTAPGPSPDRPGRVMVVAVDLASFPSTATSSAREAATRVIDRAAPEDHVGLIAYPDGVVVSPTRDRRALRDAMARIAGHRIETLSTKFNISAAEAMALRSMDMTTKEIQSRECQRDWLNFNCPREVVEEGQRLAQILEQQAMLSIAGLYGVMDAVASIDGRKTLMVVSAGLPMWTLPGSRNNLNAQTDAIARRAAAANVNLYVLYMNVHFMRFFSAAYGRQNQTIFEDISTFGSGLERFADSAGGAFFQVEVDSDPFVDRALRETTASYLLAVQVEPAERDGKEHFIRVTTKARGATIRHRRVAVIPKPG